MLYAYTDIQVQVILLSFLTSAVVTTIDCIINAVAAPKTWNEKMVVWFSVFQLQVTNLTYLNRNVVKLVLIS